MVDIPESYAKTIVGKFGGVRECGRAVGKAPSSVHRWTESGYISVKDQTAVWLAARRLRLGVRRKDFFEQDKIDADDARIVAEKSARAAKRKK